jgi:hypothetical protein
MESYSTLYSALKIKFKAVEGEVHIKYYKEIIKVWKSKYGSVPIPFTIESLKNGLPLNEQGDSVSLFTLQHYDAITSMFNAEHVRGQKARTAVTGVSPQTECEKALGRNLYLFGDDRSGITNLLANSDHVKPGSTVKYGELEIELRGIDRFAEQELSGSKPGTKAEIFDTPEDYMDYNSEAYDIDVTTGNLIKVSPRRPAKFYCTGRLYGGDCWLCRTPVWSYFGKEILESKPGKTVSERLSTDVIYTSVGECEHKAAVWPTFIVCMLANKSLDTTTGPLAYGNSHVHCNQIKDARVGIRMNKDYTWEVSEEDVTELINLILTSEIDSSEYDKKLQGILSSINNDIDKKGLIIGLVSSEYQSWCDKANEGTGTDYVKNLDIWLCRLMHTICYRYGYSWLNNWIKLEQDSLSKIKESIEKAKTKRKSEIANRRGQKGGLISTKSTSRSGSQGVDTGEGLVQVQPKTASKPSRLEGNNITHAADNTPPPPPPSSTAAFSDVNAGFTTTPPAVPTTAPYSDTSTTVDIIDKTVSENMGKVINQIGDNGKFDQGAEEDINLFYKEDIELFYYDVLLSAVYLLELCESIDALKPKPIEAVTDDIEAVTDETVIETSKAMFEATSKIISEMPKITITANKIIESLEESYKSSSTDVEPIKTGGFLTKKYRMMNRNKTRKQRTRLSKKKIVKRNLKKSTRNKSKPHKNI